MIKLENVIFQYEQEAEGSGIHNISFHLPPGSCTVLCGSSGCGKTTLLRLISGLAPSVYPGELSGNIFIGGKSIFDMTSSDKATMLGMVFQDPRSQFFMPNVLNEIAFSGENLGFFPDDILSKVKTLTAQLGLSELIDRDLDSLSSGQKQKVAIASAMLLKPPLLILDEPTANLDSTGTKTLIELLHKIKQDGTTILISEHRVHEFLPIADNFVCLKNGSIAAKWTQSEFLQLDCQKAESFGLRHPESGFIDSQKNISAAAKDLLTIKEISFRYSKYAPVIEQLNFSLHRGCVTLITGDNGAGKTTLGKILCGLLRQKNGDILWNSEALSAKCRRLKSYFVMQDADYQLYTESVGNELVLGRTLTNQIRERAYAAMELFDLTKYKDRHPASLSGGEKQRVTLAAAYCSEAELIILDEPTSGLDVVNAKRVAEFIQLLAHEDRSVAVITHDDLLLRLIEGRVINL